VTADISVSEASVLIVGAFAVMQAFVMFADRRVRRLREQVAEKSHQLVAVEAKLAAAEARPDMTAVLSALEQIVASQEAHEKRADGRAQAQIRVLTLIAEQIQVSTNGHGKDS
jgi:hypothetical protein